MSQPDSSPNQCRWPGLGLASHDNRASVLTYQRQALASRPAMDPVLTGCPEPKCLHRRCCLALSRNPCLDTSELRPSSRGFPHQSPACTLLTVDFFSPALGGHLDRPSLAQGHQRPTTCLCSSLLHPPGTVVSLSN